MTAQSAYITYAGRACIMADPAQYPLAAGKANSYFCPLGPEPGMAYLLMTRRDLDAIDFNTYHELVFSAGETVTIPRIWPVRAIRVAPGKRGDPNAAYMLEATDARWFANRFNRVMGGAGNLYYNKPEYNWTHVDTTTGIDRSYFDYGSSNSLGTPWTWANMAGNLWGRLPSALFGSWPGLPYTPHGYPEDWGHHGAPLVWCLLHEILHKLFCTTAYDPIANTWRIVELGATQTGLDDEEKRLGFPLNDLEPIESDAAVYPHTIYSLFSRQDKYYGMLPPDTKQVQLNAHLKSGATSVSGVVASTNDMIWDDLYALMAPGSDLVTDNPINNTECTDRATEVRTKYLQCVGVDSSLVVYQGARRGILPGEQVRSVLWRSIGDGFGLVTEVSKYGGFPGDRKSHDRASSCSAHEGDTNRGLHGAWRRYYPAFPHLVQWVAVGDYSGYGVSDEGFEGLEDTTNFLFDGFEVTLNPEDMAPGGGETEAEPWAQNGANYTGRRVWIRLAMRPDMTPCLPRNARYLGRLAGWATYSSSTRPLYIIEPDLTYYGKLDETLTGTLGSSATMSVWYFDSPSYADSGENIEVFSWGRPTGSGTIEPTYEADDAVIAKRCSDGRWYLVDYPAPPASTNPDYGAGDYVKIGPP